MLPTIETQGPRLSLDRGSKVDPVSRVVQLGLVIYLSPVILLVVIIGGLSLAAQFAGRVVFKADATPDRRPIRIVYHARDGKSQVEGGQRGAHIAH